MNKLLPYLFKAQKGVQTEWWMKPTSSVSNTAVKKPPVSIPIGPASDPDIKRYMSLRKDETWGSPYQFMMSWYSNPITKEKLKSQGFTGNPMTEALNQKLFKDYWDWREYKQQENRDAAEEIWGNNYKNKLELQTSLNKLVDLDYEKKYETTGGFHTSRDSVVAINKRYDLDDDSRKRTAVHELSHATPLDNHYVNYFKNNIEEIYPRIMELRYQMKLTPGRKVTPKMLEDFHTDGDYDLRNYFSPEELAKIMNDVAYVPQGNITTAKMGGTLFLPKAQRGKQVPYSWFQGPQRQDNMQLPVPIKQKDKEIAEEQAIAKIQKEKGVSRGTAIVILRSQQRGKSSVEVKQDRRFDYEKQQGAEKIKQIQKYRKEELGIDPNVSQVEIDYNTKKANRIIDNIVKPVEAASTITGLGSIGSNLLRLSASQLERAAGRNLISRTAKNVVDVINPVINTVDDALAYAQLDPIGIMGNKLNTRLFDPKTALNLTNNSVTGVGRNLKNSAVEAADVVAGVNNTENIGRDLVAFSKRNTTLPNGLPKLSVAPKTNLLTNDLDQLNQITQGDFDRVAKKEKAWLQSAEYFKRRAAATGETPAQIQKDVNNILKKFDNLSFKTTDIDDEVRGFYDASRNFIGINENLTRQEALPTIDHEVKHSLSQLAGSKLFKYRNYPGVKIGNTVTNILEPLHTHYLKLPFEQQVRGLRGLDFIEKTQGVPRGVKLKKEDIDTFIDNINGPLRHDFRNEYDDVVDMLIGMKKADQRMKFAPKNILKGKFPFKYEDQGNFRNRLLDFFNKAYIVPGAIGAAALQEKRKGGPIVDPRGQWAHPGKHTMVPTPTGQITMQGVPYPVYGQDETGYGQMMMPGGEYRFPGKMVYEIPMMQRGGQRAPIYTKNPRDPRIKAYNDSLFNYKLVSEADSKMRKALQNSKTGEEYDKEYERLYKLYTSKGADFVKGMSTKNPLSISKKFSNNSTGYYSSGIPIKPVQPVVYKKPVPPAPKKANPPVQAVEQQPVVLQPQFPAYRMKGNTPVYGPTNSLIGMLDSRSGDFYPDYENTAARAGANQADADMISNMQLIQEYLKSKGVANPKILPKQKKGGQHGGLDRWFAEKWVDVKTGKQCGRQEGEDRAYPACRPSRRVSSETPKTSSEMSPAEKAKFKRSKTSSERIPYNHQRKQFGGMTTADSVRHQANKILQYEQLRGGPGGAPLPGYSDPKYMSMLMNNIYPEVKRILPNSSAMEAAEAMDFIFNAGWDQANNKVVKDPRAYALQEYYRQHDPSKLDADGKWAGRKNSAYSFDQEYNATIGKLSENDRRVIMNRGRDWYYRNINNPAPGVPNSNYYDTWYGRIWNTNDFQPFNPNNPNFKPKKK